MNDATEFAGPEFTRPIEVARVAKLGSHEKISADPQECAALAKRFKVPAVHAVRAHLQAKPWRGGGLKVWGEAVIELTQESVVSLEAFQTSQTIVVERYYLASTPDDLVDSELEIDPD